MRAPEARPRSQSGMAQIFAHSLGGQAVMGALVSLRDHVRGAVHPEHARCRHSGRALHVAGSAWASVCAPCRQRLVSEYSGDFSYGRRRVGILSLLRHDRSARRDQFVVAAVRNRQPDAGDYRAMRRDQRDDPIGQSALRIRHAAPADLAGRGDDDRRIEKIFSARPTSDSSRTRRSSQPRRRLRRLSSLRAAPKSRG